MAQPHANTRIETGPAGLVEIDNASNLWINYQLCFPIRPKWFLATHARLWHKPQHGRNDIVILSILYYSTSSKAIRTVRTSSDQGTHSFKILETDQKRMERIQLTMVLAVTWLSANAVSRWTEMRSENTRNYQISALYPNLCHTFSTYLQLLCKNV